MEEIGLTILTECFIKSRYAVTAELVDKINTGCVILAWVTSTFIHI